MAQQTVLTALAMACLMHEEAASGGAGEGQLADRLERATATVKQVGGSIGQG